MTGKILDIEKWKTEYTFLNEIWKFYDKLDETLSETDNGAYSQLCSTVGIYGTDRLDEKENTCKRLFRNTFLLSNGGYSFDIFPKYCDILYIWLYFEIKKNSHDASIINKIFQGSIDAIKAKRKNIPCPYFSYHEILHEPEKLMKLSTFNKNAETFQSILMKKSDSNDCSCQKYVLDCVNIYNDMHRKHCSGRNSKNNTELCKIVNTFGTLYAGYIYEKREDISYELQPLSSTTTNHVVNCPTDIRSEISTSTGEGSSSDVSKTLHTALGTMAGATSLLALLYKFTPTRSWIHTRLRGKKEMINSSLDENAEKKLLYDGLKREDLYSYSQGFDIGYSPS